MPPAGEPPTPTPPVVSTVQTAEPTAPDRILLPPPTPVAPEPPRRRWSVLDSVLAAVVLGFAFLVASAPARNSDLWLHLATGRDLLAGKAPFGVDPFSQGGERVFWVNTNWLYDASTYLLFQGAGGLDGLGGAALVLFKALLVTILAAVLIRLGWCGRGLWAPAVGAAWAVLVLSPWLLLHPMIVSYLFLGLTLFFLERPHRPADDGFSRSGPVSFTAYWPLLPLFVLWVNLDSWFLLGPLTVALYLLGQVLQSRFGPDAPTPPSPTREGREGRGVRPGEVKALGIALGVGLAACLLNPYHVFAFLTPPVQLGLSPAARVLAQDPDFKRLLWSPFQTDYMHSGGPGWNAAGWAYFPLVLLGGLSFLLNFSGWRWRRFLVCAATFLLSAFQVRCVPFFAIAAGPALALNVQEFLARQAPAWRTDAVARRSAAAGRTATLLAGLALLVVGWPGWLHAPPCERPRWAVEADPGLRQTAEQMARWRRDGGLGPRDVGFNLSADAANYFAWFCPEEKGVVDARQAPFSPEAAADFVAVRKALSDPGAPMTFEEVQALFAEETLAPEDGADPAHLGGPPMEAVRAVLRRRHADHLIVYDNDRSTAFSWVQRLRRYPGEWPLLHLDGRAAVFGWRDPAAPAPRDPFPRVDPVELNRLAFRPPDGWKAPRAGPDREPSAADWTDPFLRSYTPRTSLAEEAELYLRSFDEDSEPHGYRTVEAWKRSLTAAVVGAASCADGSVVAPSTMALPWDVLVGPAGLPKGVNPTPADQFLFWCRSDFQERQDDGPVGLLYLALRAARRAVRADPDDARAYLVLGEVYKRLLRKTAERVGYTPRAFLGKGIDEVPLAFRVRTAEAVAAYTRALRLNPDLVEAHMGLMILYQDLNYQDEAAKHFQEVLRCHRQGGPGPGEDPKQFAARIQDLEDLVAAKDKEVKGRLDQFEVEAAGQTVYARAELAWKKFGLADKALSILLPSGVEDFGREGEVLELELLLHTGRQHDARTWPQKDEAMAYLGKLPFLAIQVELEAASGNYDAADDDLSRMIQVVRGSGGEEGDALPTRTSMAMAVLQALLESEPQDGDQAYVVRTALFFPPILVKTQQMTAGLVEEANLTTLRGALALEVGDVDSARDFFRAALAVWGDETRAATGAGLDFSSRPLAQAGLAALENADR